MLDYAATLLTLVAFGAHAIVPWRLARGDHEGADETARRAWALAALPLLLAGAALGAAFAGARPHAALGAGWGELALTDRAFLAAFVLVAALVLADAVLAAGYRRLEPAGWRLAGGLGLAALAAVVFAFELLRIGTGPTITLGPVVLAAGGRLAMALAAGETLAPGRRPWLAPMGALGLAGYWLALPPRLRALLLDEGLHLTGLATLLLFAFAPLLPPRLRRPAVVAAVLLAALLLTRAGALTASLPMSVPSPSPPI